MEPTMQPRSNASPDEFRDRVAHLQTWAAVAASRAHDLSYEWPAVASVLAALYLLLVVPSMQTLGFLDIVVLVGVLGTGYSLNRFEHNSAVALARLVRAIAHDKDSSVQSSESGHVGY